MGLDFLHHFLHHHLGEYFVEAPKIDMKSFDQALGVPRPPLPASNKKIQAHERLKTKESTQLLKKIGGYTPEVATAGT